VCFLSSFAPHLKTQYKAHIALVGTSLIFGANYWIAKGLMPGYLDPYQLVLIRIAGATALFWILGLTIKTESITGSDLRRIAFAAVLGTTVNQLFFFVGLNLTTPVDVSIIHVTNPIFVLIFASILIKERITYRKTGGIILGASGALILVIYGKQAGFGSDSFKGNLFAVFNMLAYALYMVIIKPVMRKYHPFTVMKWVFLTGFITTFPITFTHLPSISFTSFETTTWLSLIYVIVATTFMAYLLTIYALKHVEASVASYYIYLQPFIVALIAFWLGVQNFTISKLIAAMLIFSGVYLVSRKGGEKNSV
jgi:drug/metabolite transporter (DMT)-like permease